MSKDQNKDIEESIENKDDENIKNKIKKEEDISDSNSINESLEKRDDNEDSSLEEVISSKEKEETLLEEISKLKDEKLRSLAEMENLRKRSDRERVDLIKYGSIDLARDILSFSDNLSRAIEAIPESEKKSESITNLIDGLKMVQKEFNSIIEKHGVKKIEALNKNFDHNFHQAMLEVEDSKADEGVVIQEIQTGYTMHDRLLRPSMVGVSKKPSEDKKNDQKT